MQTVYFDYNATTPLDPAVRDVMLPFLANHWGNPSSVHHVGRQARSLLDDARDRASRVLGCKPSEVIFTSGGTESTNLAVLGTARRLRSKGQHLITSAVEHHAVLHCCDYLARQDGFEITRLPVDAEGRVSVADLERALRPDTVLVSVMAANNEIGTLQPVAELGQMCRNHGVLFHTDAVQWFGKISFESLDSLNADLVSICAHKIHGPKGAGLLFARSPTFPDPLHFGGGHENEHRAGTENLAAIVGMVEALERFIRRPVFDSAQLKPLTDRLLKLVRSLPGVHFVGSPEHRLTNTISFVAEGADSIALLAGLDMEGICASSGSACSAGSLEPSHVIQALGLSTELANSLVRFSLGRASSSAEVDYAEKVLPKVLRRAQRLQ